MPDRLRRLDLHARQLQLSELLDPASRTFAAALQLGMLEAKAEIDALVAGASFTERAAERLYRRHLSSYFAAAVMMPYDRFLRACEATGYDIEEVDRENAADAARVKELGLSYKTNPGETQGARATPQPEPDPNAPDPIPSVGPSDTSVG
jgi:predicted transcriptional regulator